MLTETTIGYYTNSDLERTIDHAKAVIISAMVADGLLDLEAGDEWSLNHTIMIRKKGFFRSILSKVWKNSEAKESERFFMVVELNKLAIVPELPTSETEEPEIVPIPEESKEDTDLKTI